MARIRTIKPEFWTSEQVVDCSPTTRLLFIGIWNFVDDHGVIPTGSKRLKMLIFPGDEISLGEIQRMVEELLSVGLLGEFEHEGHRYWYVTGWNTHQRIEKPTFKYPDVTQGVIIKFGDNSPTTPRPIDDHSATEGNGKEGKGKESSGCSSADETPVERQSKRPAKPAGPDTSETWAAYRAAYFHRYGAKVPGGRTINSQMKAFVEAVGMQNGPSIAAYYVSMNNSGYVQKRHPVNILLADWQAISTAWQTGTRITAAEAREADRVDAEGEKYKRVLAWARERDSLKAEGNVVLEIA